MWLSWESISIESVDSNMVFFQLFFFLLLHIKSPYLVVGNPERKVYSPESFIDE